MFHYAENTFGETRYTETRQKCIFSIEFLYQLVVVLDTFKDDTCFLFPICQENLTSSIYIKEHNISLLHEGR